VLLHEFAPTLPWAAKQASVPLQALSPIGCVALWHAC
jgi:hypothetical protein